MASLPMSQSGLRGPKMIPDDQYNMFLTIWGHFGPNLAYKKILGKFTKVLGFGKTPPPCWEKFPNNIVFFVWQRTLVGYLAQDLQQCHWQAIIHPSHTRNWESKSFPREKDRTPRLLAVQFRQNFTRTMTQINCRLCQFPSGEVGNLKKHIKSEHEVIIKT